MSNKKNIFRRISFVSVFLSTLLFFGGTLLKANVSTIKEHMDANIVNGKPILVIDSNLYDFGNIKPNSQNTAVFNMFNIGNATLVLNDVKNCCGAKTALTTKNISPGQSEILSVQYNVGNDTGIFNKTITMATNDPNQNQIELSIKGNVVPTLSWTPKDFKVATYEKDINLPEINIKSLTETPFSIKRIITTSKYILCDSVPGVIAKEFILKPKIIVEKIKESNIQTGIIDIELNHPDYENIKINIDLIPLLQINPRVIYIYDAQENESVIRTVEIIDNFNRNNMNVSTSIKSMVSENGTKAELISSSISEKGFKLRLKFTPVRNRQQNTILKDSIIVCMKDGFQFTLPIRIIYTN